MRSPTDSCDGQSLLAVLYDILGFFIGRDAERKRVVEALGIVSVPRLSVGGYAGLLVAWPTAETSFMDPGTGVIDPADTRDVVVRFLEHSRTRTAIGRHRLAGWPTKF